MPAPDPHGEPHRNATPAPDTPRFRVYRSGDTALIRDHNGADIEMPVADALALADVIVAEFRTAPATAFRRWSANDDAELTRLHLNGGSVKAIATQLGRSVMAVHARRSVLGLSARDEKAAAAGRARWQTRRAAQ